MDGGGNKITTATLPPDVRRRHGFFKFYWTCSKHFGSKVWETKGAELVSALVLTVVILAVSWILGQKDANKAFEIGIISLGGWLAVFAIGHLVRTPVLFHREEVEAKALASHWIFGIIGIVVAVLIASTLVGVGWWLYSENERPTALPSVDPGALRPTIEKQREEIAALKARVPDERSLKVRSLEAADEFEKFWKRQPKAPTCTQTAGMTPEQQQKVLMPCVEYYNRRTAEYQQVLAPRIIAIVEGFRSKGVNVKDIENCVQTAFCGLPISVQLRAFSERLDAQDNVR